MTDGNAPCKRRAHQSVFIGGKMYVFGGDTGGFVWSACPSDEIFVLNCHKKTRKWIRYQTTGLKLNFIGGRSVAIDGIIYSYNPDGNVSRLDPDELEWEAVASSAEGQKPQKRLNSYLWAIGSKLIMFGGEFLSAVKQSDCQPGSQEQKKKNNEIFEFQFEKGNKTGLWADLELAGARPGPRAEGAMTTIDHYRGILHGGRSGDGKMLGDTFVIDLASKTWIPVHFDGQHLSDRCCHTLCLIEGVVETVCLLIGGCKGSSAWVLDVDKPRANELNMKGSEAEIYNHSAYCLTDNEGNVRLFLCGGNDVRTPFNGTSKSILTTRNLDTFSDFKSLKLSIDRSSYASSLKTGEHVQSEEYDCGQSQCSSQDYNHSMVQKDAEIRELRNQLDKESSQHEVARQELETEVKLLHQQLEEKNSQIEMLKKRLNSEADDTPTVKGDEEFGSGSSARASPETK